MKVQKQTGNECILATIATLAELPLPVVRAKARTVIKPFPNWPALQRQSCVDTTVYQFAWYAIDALVETYDLPFALFMPAPTSPMLRIPLFDMADLSRITYHATIPEKGRGVVDLLLVADSGRRTRHMVAWGNGLLYDSNNFNHGEGLPLEVNLRAYIGGHVYAEAIKAVVE